MLRAVTNVIRWPLRTLKSRGRRRDPAYRLQLQADRALPRLFGKQLLRDLEGIPGTSSARECRLLAHLVVQAPPAGCIVEIGAYLGKTTAWLVEAAKLRSDHPTVVSIDPHQLQIPGQGSTWELFQKTVARFDLHERGLEIQRVFSHELGQEWRRPISLLWIDGSHEYDDVVNDIEDYVPHVLPGGWIVFDDASGGYFPGAERAVAERMLGRSGFDDRGIVKRFHVFQRAKVGARGLA